MFTFPAAFFVILFMIRNNRNLIYLLCIFRAEQSTRITLREQVEAMPLISLKFALKQT